MDDLPVVGWAIPSYALLVSDACKRLGQSPGATVDLTPRAPAQAALEQARAERDAAREEVERLTRELELAKSAPLYSTRADAARYRWIRSLTIGYRDEENAKRFRLPNIESDRDIMRGSVAQHLDAAIDAAIDAALKSPTPGKEQT